MILTSDMILKHEPCEGSVDIFNRFFPRGFDLSIWTKDFQIKLIRKTRLREYIGWAWDEGLIPMWSMNQANLDGASLNQASLDGARINKDQKEFFSKSQLERMMIVL